MVNNNNGSILNIGSGARKCDWVPPLLILYNFCANLANDIYLPSMPLLTKLFSTSPSMLQLTMTVWFAGVALPQFFFGPLTDRFGRKPILLIGGLCFIFSTLCCALAPNVWVLIAARFFQGVGVCSLNVTTFSILADLFAYKKRTHIMNQISMCATLAPLLGPVIGGYVLEYFGWRANFAIILLLGVLSVLGLKLSFSESNLYLNPHALNWRNICKSYWLLLINKKFVRHLLPYCLLLGALVAYITVSPFIIISQFKISAEYFGFTQFPIFAAYFVGSLYLQKIDNENTLRKALLLGLILVFIGSAILFCASLFSNTLTTVNLVIFLLPMSIYALGFSLCASTLTNEVMSAAVFNKGSAAALLSFGMATACMLASLFNSVIYNGTLFAIAGLIFVLVLIAVSCYFFLLKERNIPVDERNYAEETSS